MTIKEGEYDVRSLFGAIGSVVFAALVIAGCSSPDSSDVTVLDLVPPSGETEAAEGTDPAQPDGGDEGDLSAEGIGDDGTTGDAQSDADPETTGTPDPSATGTPTGDTTPEPTDEEIAAAVAEAIMSTSNVVLESKIEDGAAIAGRTACTGVTDTSTQYPIGLELIVGPPGRVGSGTPRIVVRSYDDAATAQAAAAARIASLKTCVTSATQNNPALQWGTGTVDRPIPGDQLWFPTGTMTETHVAYSSGRFYAVASNQVAANTFIPGQVDAWSVSAVQRVIDTLEAETQAEANPTPTPEGQ